MVSKNRSAKYRSDDSGHHLSDPGAKEKQAGMERGMSTPIVPQEVPVVKEIKIPRRKQKEGKAGRESYSKSAKGKKLLKLTEGTT